MVNMETFAHKKSVHVIVVDKAEEWARSKRGSSMTVSILKEWPVFALYRKLGFTIEFERRNHSRDSIGCYLIKKLS